MADKPVTVRVISDTPVDRVYKGDTLSLSEAIAEQFIKLELVEMLKDATPTVNTAAATITKI